MMYTPQTICADTDASQNIACHRMNVMMDNLSSTYIICFLGADPRFWKGGSFMYKFVGARLADFISFFLSIP